MKSFIYRYQRINILSLDVVAGAVISAAFFARLFDVSLPVSVLASLGLTVWIIYTVDHLRDAMTIPRIASTDRHRFHQKYFRRMFAMLAIACVIDAITVLFLPGPTLWAGLMLGGIVLMYLILQRYLKFLKEFFVACLYTAGIVLPAVVMTDAAIPPVHILIIGKFFITAWMNLLLFSLFDYQEDKRHLQHSFVTWFGPASTRIGIVVLGLVNIVSGLWLWTFDVRIAAVFIAMNLLLLSILLLGKRMVVNDYYRMLGDAVFFIPVLYLL